MSSPRGLASQAAIEDFVVVWGSPVWAAWVYLDANQP